MSREVCEHFVPKEIDCYKCNWKQRWYKIDGDRAYVYDSPHEDTATSISIVSTEDLQYYRNKFSLAKLWSGENANALSVS